jgi:hypothetical protein
MGTANQGAQYAIATQTQRGVASGNEMMGLLFGSGNPAQNHIINGGFDFDQRGIIVTAAQAYGADRWFLSHDVTSGSMGRANPGDGTVTGFVNVLTLTTRGSGATFEMTQAFESVNVALLAGKQVCLSYKVKRNAALSSGQVWFGATFGSGTDQKLPTGVGSQISSVNVTDIPTSGYVTISHTFVVPTNAKSMRVRIGMFNGAIWPDGSVLSAGDAMFNIGSVAQPFARAGGSIGGEELLCKRYFNKEYSNSSNKYFGIIGATISTTRVIGSFSVPVPMRIAPTPTFSNCYFVAIGGSTPYLVSGPAIYSMTRDSQNISVDLTVATMPSVSPYAFFIGAPGYVQFDAEL